MSYLNLKKEEYHSTIYGFIYSFLIVGLFILSKSLRDSLFLNNFTKQDLSYLYFITPIISGILVWLILLIFKKINLFKKSLIIHLVLFVISVVLLLNINNINILLYYIFVDFQVAVIAIIFWDVLSESFTSRQAKRLFSIITSGGFLSALIVGSSLSTINHFISQENSVLVFNFLILFCPIFIYQLILNTNKNKIENKSVKKSASFNEVFKNRYIRNIIFITFLFTALAIIIDYNFKLIAYEKFQNSSVELTNFFARFYSFTAFISFIIQISLSGYVINRFGIKYAMMILPMLLLVTFILGYFISPFIIVMLLKGKEHIFKSTLHDTSMHILWMPVPSFKRLTIKPFVNIFLKNIFSSLSASFLILSVYFQFTFIHFIPFCFLILIALLFLTRRTKDFYVKELIRAIDDRSLSFQDESSVQISDDNEMLSIINKKLISETHNRYFILHLLDDNIIEKCKSTLADIFKDSDSNSQKLILKYLKYDNDLIQSDFLIEQVNNNSDICIESLEVLCSRNVSSIDKINDNLLDSKALDLKYSAINNSIKNNYKSKKKALDILGKDIYISENLSFIINNISSSSYDFSKQNILDLFLQLDYDDFINSLKFINENNINHELLEFIVTKLCNGYYFNDKVYDFFRKNNGNQLYNFFEFKLLDSKSKFFERKFICDMIKYIDDINYISIYYKYLDLIKYDHQIIENIFDHLIFIKRENEKYFEEKDIIDSILNKVIYNQYYDLILLSHIQSDSNKPLFEEYYINKIDDNKRLLMKILNFSNNDIFNKNFQLSMFEKKIYESKIIEIFEEYLSEPLKNKVIPILDDIQQSEKNNFGLKFYNNLSDLSINSLYDRNKINTDDWYLFILFSYSKKNKNLFTHDGLLNNRYFKLLINSLNFNENKIVDLNNEIINDLMITNLEKTLYLKDSNIFKDIPAKELIHIANCLKEINLSNSQNVFKDGDVGDSMYFIVKGEVQILKGDTELVALKKSDYFGEMALLDGESRSADAIARGDCILLELNANDFDRIMYSNDKIVKGILGMLSQRLRHANELLNQKK